VDRTLAAAPVPIEARRARRRERGENFPVAFRLLPAAPRRHLHVVYAVARLVDDTGDDPAADPGQRSAALDRLDAELDAITAGIRPQLPVMQALARTVAECALPVAPFHDLVQANRADQSLRQLATYDDLRRYCALSAEPVGRVVLAIAGADTPANRVMSDRVCTALQILEHCQDVVEDKRDHDRVYLPADDLVRCAVEPDDLLAPTASPQLRVLIELEVARADTLLAMGAPLVGALRGWARLAVAGYVAGGLATVDALRRAGYDVVTQLPRPRRVDVARHAARLVVTGR
jgi:squalene synthase HpnC